MVTPDKESMLTTATTHTHTHDRNEYFMFLARSCTLSHFSTAKRITAENMTAYSQSGHDRFSATTGLKQTLISSLNFPQSFFINTPIICLKTVKDWARNNIHVKLTKSNVMLLFKKEGILSNTFRKCLVNTIKQPCIPPQSTNVQLAPCHNPLQIKTSNVFT